MTATTTPNTLIAGSLSLVARAVQLRAIDARTSATTAQKCAVSPAYEHSAEYLTAQAARFEALAAKLADMTAGQGHFTAQELKDCRESVELQRRKAIRRPGGEQYMYVRLGDKLTQMLTFLEPFPDVAIPAEHFDVSTTADGMHLPRCGQVSARGYGPARTRYTTDTAKVTCRKCSAVLAKAYAANAAPLAA